MLRCEERINRDRGRERGNSLLEIKEGSAQLVLRSTRSVWIARFSTFLILRLKMFYFVLFMRNTEAYPAVE